MNAKPAQQVLSFEGQGSDYSKSSPFQSYRGDKSRMSYGGGFHMSKKSTPSTLNQIPESSHPAEIANRMISPNGYSSIDVLEGEIQRLKMQSSSIEQLRTTNYASGILHIDPWNHRHTVYEEPAQPTRSNISLQELEVLKEKNAARLLEIEAELLRNKQPVPEFKSKAHEYVPLFLKPKQVSNKPKNIQEHQRKYQDKFEKYLQDKEKKRVDGLIKGKELKVSDSAREEKEETLDTRVLLKWMFKKLDKDRSGSVDKVELVQEFHQNPDLTRMFGFTEQINSPRYMQRFEEMFEKIGIGSRHEITLNEFLLFFDKFSAEKKPAAPKPQKPEKRQSPPKPILKNSASSRSLKAENLPICLLPHKHMAKLEEVFTRLDYQQDLVVNKGEFINALTEDPGIIKILHIDAVRVSAYQILDLESMLTYIRSDGDGEEGFITWNQFLEYFFVQPLFEEGKFEGVENPELEEIDLHPKYMAFVQEIFEDLPKEAVNKVSTFEFIRSVRNDQRTRGILHITARNPNGLSHIPEETVDEVLTRIEESAESLISWVDVIGYFSKRGLPKNAITAGYITKNSFVKIKMPQKPVAEFAMQTEDLDPKKLSSRSRSVSPRPRVAFEQEKSFEKPYTVPEPFGFEEREKLKPKSIREKWVEKLVKTKEEEENKHINFKYKSRDVPTEVSRPKYESLKQALQERSEYVKRVSAEKTKELERPFNFYLREKEKEKAKRPPSPPKEYTFKANPIPWACTVPLYESKLKEDEAYREERKSRAAQKDLRKASLPPRMEMYAHMHKNQVPEPRTPSPKFKVKEPPNFEKLHDRFAKTLEAKKKAKQTTKVEPFLIDSRVEESIRKKEEKKKIKEENERKIKEEEERKRREEEDKAREERRKQRMQAKDSWRTEHESIKKARGQSARLNKSIEEEKKGSPGRRLGAKKGNDFSVEDLRPGGFTHKDLQTKAPSMTDLKPSRTAKAAHGKTPVNAASLAPSKPTKPSTSTNAKPSLAPNKASQGSSKPSLAPKASSDAFTAKDLHSPASSSGFTKEDLHKQTSSSSLLAPGLKTINEEPQKSLAPGPNPLAPSFPSPLAPGKPSQFPNLSSKSAQFNPLAPSPTPSSNPLAPSHTDPPASNPLAPSAATSNPLAPKAGMAKTSAPKRAKDPKSNTTKNESFSQKPNSGQEYRQAIVSKLKTVISAEEAQAAQEKGNIDERLRKRKEDSKNDEIQYQQKLKEMKEKVGQSSLLVQSATDSSSKNKSKMKTLMQIKKSLEDSGVKYESYFSKEELDLIQEGEYLEKMHSRK